MIGGINIQSKERGISMKRLDEVTKVLKCIECKSYNLTVQFDDDYSIAIDKKATTKDKLIGFNMQ